MISQSAFVHTTTFPATSDLVLVSAGQCWSVLVDVARWGIKYTNMMPHEVLLTRNLFIRQTIVSCKSTCSRHVVYIRDWREGIPTYTGAKRKRISILNTRCYVIVLLCNVCVFYPVYKMIIKYKYNKSKAQMFIVCYWLLLSLVDFCAGLVIIYLFLFSSLVGIGRENLSEISLASLVKIDSR